MVMKKRTIFSLATASMLAMASCSDSLESGGTSNGTTINGDAVYLTLNIKTPASSSTGTRAGGANDDPTGGENGDGNLTALTSENYVRSATVVLYTVEGATDLSNVDINTAGAKVVTSAYTESVEYQKSGNTEYANHDYKANIRINSDDLKAGVPYRILTIANANVAAQFPKDAELNSAKLEKYSQHVVGDESLRGRFVMSTHTEKNTLSNTQQVTQSIVTFDGTETTGQKAQEATVWVERLSARIDYIGKDFDFNVLAKDDEGKYTDQKLATASLLGLAPVNVAKHEMYIFKQVTKDSNINSGLVTLGDETPVNDLSDPYEPGAAAGTNYVIEPTTSETGNKVFDNQFIESEDGAFIKALEEKTGELGFTDFSNEKWQVPASTTATDTTRIICYAGENTMGVDNQIHGLSTGVIFKVKYDPIQLYVYNSDGTVSLKDVTDISSYGNAAGFYRVDNKIYYDLAAAEAELIIAGSDLSGTDALTWLRKNFTKTDWTDTENIPTTENLSNALSNATQDLGYMSWLQAQLESTTATALDANTMNWAAFLASDAGKNLPTNSTTTNKKIEGDNTVTIEYYDPNHVSYYPYWIRHANNGDPNKMGIMEFAIVRNNVYQLEVTAIDDLGMADPFDSTTTPDEGDETGLYMKVNLYVKDWVKRMNNNIVLQ